MDRMGWDKSPGGVRYRAPYGVKNLFELCRYTLGDGDAGWAKHDLTYRVKNYPSDQSIQRHTVRK